MTYTDEMIAFLKEYVAGKHRNETIAEFNRRYPETPITLNSYKAVVKKYNLKTGLTGRFEKGRVSHNKGLKQSDFMSQEAIERTKETRFKKGQTPHNHKPVGSTRLNVDGYIEIKVAEPNKWRLNARVVWENAYGPIPKGKVLIHINGRTSDDRLENLMLLTRSELVRVNQQKLFCDDTEINKTAIAIAKLTDGIGRARKRKKEGGK